MSERFYIHCGDDINKQLMDTESDFNIHIEEVGGDEDLLIQLCDLLNEQQSIIHRDERSIKTMMSNMKKLEEENEQLRKKLEQIYSFKGLNCRCVNGV